MHSIQPPLLYAVSMIQIHLLYALVVTVTAFGQTPSQYFPGIPTGAFIPAHLAPRQVQVFTELELSRRDCRKCISGWSPAVLPDVTALGP
jgi:hypothetical protein